MPFAGVLYCSTTFLIFAVHAHPLEHVVTIGRTRRTVADGKLAVEASPERPLRWASTCGCFDVGGAKLIIIHYYWSEEGQI